MEGRGGDEDGINRKGEKTRKENLSEDKLKKEERCCKICREVRKGDIKRR